METLQENILVPPLTGKEMERGGIISNGHTSALRVSKGDTSVDPSGSSLRDLCPRKPRQMQSYYQKMDHNRTYMSIAPEPSVCEREAF